MKSRTSGQALEGAATRKTVRRAGLGLLRTSEIRFRRLFETTQDGILILDGATHKILAVNPFILKLLGYSKSELLGKDLAEVGILLNKRVRRQIFNGFQRRSSGRFEYSWTKPTTNESKELEFVCNSYDERDRTLIQCNVRDIAARKETERKLRHSLERLAAAKAELEARFRDRTTDLQQRNAELEAFSYSLSHDLRAPIRAIVSFTELALEEYRRKVGSPATGLLERAIGAAQRLDQLVMDVLAFSQATRQRITAERVDVEGLIREILAERSELALSKVDIHIEAPLLLVRGDRASLTQCLTNLLDNAVKFVRPGAVARVRVYTEKVGNRVRLCVEDNGLGIPVSAQGRVFDLFQRAHNGYEGHGIGLAIVRRAAERMGGTVGLSSQPGKGSTFWVELPSPLVT